MRPILPDALLHRHPGARKALFVMFLIAGSFLAAAQQWQQMPIVSQALLTAGISPGGEGGQVIRGVISSSTDPDFVLAATDVGGIYRSLNGGNNWQVCMVGWNARGGNGFAIDPHNADHIVGIGANSNDYGSANGLYVSTNQGASWSQSLSIGTGSQGDIEFDKSSYSASLGICTIAYYDGPTGIWKSTNGGTSWSKIKEGFYNAQIEVHPALGYLYVASNDGADRGFWRSSDGGSSFTQYTTDYVTGLDVIETQPDHVYISRWFKVWKSTDAGVNFDYVGNNYDNDGLPDNTPLHGITVSPSNPDYMLVYYDAGNWNWPRYFTHDGGDTWQTATVSTTNSFLPVNARSPFWSFHSTNANIVYSNGGDILTKSTDGGQTYVWSGNGENAVMVGGMINISPSSPNTVLLSFQDYNAAVTTNAGTSWIYANPSGNDWGGYCYGGYAVDGNVMWLGNADSWGGTRYLKVSRDGGATWTNMKDGSNNNIAFGGPDIGYSDPNNANNCFASNWRSTDKGLSWSAMGGCDAVFTSNPAGAKELYGKKDSNIVTSTDGGATWTTVFTVPGDFRDVAYDHVRNRFYVASEDQLKAIENNTISSIPTPQDQYGTTRVATVAVDPSDPAIVYAGNHRDLYACTNAVVRSTDAGQSWENLTGNAALGASDPGGPHEVMSIRVHPSARYAWVSGQCYGMWRIAPPGSGLTFDGLYKVIAKHSGKAMDVSNVSTADGAAVHQWEYLGASNQQWDIIPEGAYYKISAHHSGKALDVSDLSTADGAMIQQWGYGGGDNQLWRIQEVENGYYRIVSKLSDKSIDVAAGSTTNGAAILQWTSHNGDNQRWAITPVSAGARMDADEEAGGDEGTLSVYPNPSSTTVTVKSETPLCELNVHDNLGRQVYHKPDLNQSEVTIPVDNLTKGPYVLKGITIKGGRVSGKLIVR